MNDLGVETSWALIEGSDAFFVVTKAIHNALQGAETQLDEEMRTTYIERIRNALELPPGFDVMIIHDLQPAGILQVLEDRLLEAGGSGAATSTCPRRTNPSGSSSSPR